MQAEFWHERWAEDRIGFHQQRVNPHLTQYWSQVTGLDGNTAMSDAKVFVPLCGKSRDILWLQQQGHAIFGVELSDIALQSFFTENDLRVRRESIDHFECYCSSDIQPSITLLAGDYFSVTPSQVADCAAFYDRASLIALPEAMRVNYAAHLGQLMRPGARGMLVSIAYNQAQMPGPPFSVSDEVVHELLHKDFEITQLARFDGPQYVGNLAKRGLETLDERVYLLVRRP